MKLFFSQRANLLTIAALMISSIYISACSPNTGLNDSMSGADSALTVDSDGDIVGGMAVADTDPIASSTVQLFNIAQKTMCTGSLIANNLILTAAHCTDEVATNLIVIFSIKSPQSAEELKKMPLRQVTGGKVHANWPRLTKKQASNWGDIAILKFKGSLPMGYRPAKLAARNAFLSDGMDVVLAGYGITSGITRADAVGLNKVSVPLARARYSDTELLMDQRQGRGACHGDSGGPAFINLKGQNVVIGVTSRGAQDPKDTCLGFSVYTSVASMGAWIEATAKEMLLVNFSGLHIPQPAAEENEAPQPRRAHF